MRIRFHEFTPCRTERRSEIWAIPSLCRATPSATSEHLVELLGSSPIPRSVVASCVSFQLRPLPSAGVTQLHRYYEPLRHPTRPGLSLTSCQLIHTAITAGTSRVAHDPLCVHAVANTPAGLMEFVRSYRSTNFGLPRNRGGSAPALVFSRPAQRSLRLRPACSPGRLRDPLHQRLQQFRRLHYCSDCYRVERTRSRTGLTPAVDHHLSRRTRSRHLGNQLPHLRQVRLSGTIHPAVFKFGQTQISYWRTISEWEGHRPTAQRYL